MTMCISLYCSRYLTSIFFDFEVLYLASPRRTPYTYDTLAHYYYADGDDDGGGDPVKVDLDSFSGSYPTKVDLDPTRVDLDPEP